MPPNIDERAVVWYSRPMSKKPTPASSRQSSKTSKQPPAPPAAAYPSQTGRPSLGAEVFGCRLPVAYLRILDEESAAMGGEGRRQLLWKLHLRRLGKLKFERPKDFPKREARAADLREIKLYKWPLTPEQRQSVEAELESSGVRQLSMYVVLLLCDWVGLSPFTATDVKTPR